MRRYRFHHFTLSPRRRVLLRNGVEQPLIPRYFDLLHYLIQRRADAVHRRDIFDAVWTDAVVSDSALSQAIRTIRRVLGDDSREPQFLRTVSRHGYQFIYVDVIDEEDSPELDPAPVSLPADTAVAANDDAGVPLAAGDGIAPLLDRILLRPANDTEEEDQRDAAERLHALGTAEVLQRLEGRAGSARARALLRDTRWDTPLAGAVPLLGTPDGWRASVHLVALRVRRAAGLAASRWAGASAGAALAGAAGGAFGGVLLVIMGAETPLPVVPVLATLGLLCGGLAGAGVGAGMAAADAVLRSGRTAGLVAGAAAGGGVVGLAIQLETRWLLQLLANGGPRIGGGLDGLLLGAATGAGYALATRGTTDGTPAPKGPARLRVATITGVCAGAAALMLSAMGRPLVGGTVHLLARTAGGHGLLGPLGQLIGEPDFGIMTAALIAAGEGMTFGAGVAFGLTRRR